MMNILLALVATLTLGATSPGTPATRPRKPRVERL
jgi:hypothetical protein